MEELVRVDSDEMVEFESGGRQLLWKMEIYPEGDKYLSPFLWKIRPEYYWKS